ncbi:MAG: 2OG-Fe(II) oxygenase [Betaproteobacteria bacterium]
MNGEASLGEPGDTATGRPPAELNSSDVARITRAFSRSECAEIISLRSQLQHHKDGFLTSGEVRGASEVCWLRTTLAPEWLLMRVRETLHEAARQFDFDISLPLEDLKLMKYGHSNRVAWHVDCGGGRTRTRKLTLTALLSEPGTFAGGELTVGGYPNQLHRDIGDVVIFPSFLAHKVTTVTSGTRHTLIAWAHGTPFR